MCPHDFGEVQRTVSHHFCICNNTFYWLFTSIFCVEFHQFCSRKCLGSLDGPDSPPWLFINTAGAAWGNLKDTPELPSRAPEPLDYILLGEGSVNHLLGAQAPILSPTIALGMQMTTWGMPGPHTQLNEFTSTFCETWNCHVFLTFEVSSMFLEASRDGVHGRIWPHMFDT